MQNIIDPLRENLELVVKKNNASCLLFSGGLDTSILASLNPNVIAITVTLEEYGEDIKYAKSLARKLKLRHYLKIVGIEEAINSIPDIIRILKSFDPAIPNDLVVYFGLKTAKEIGVKSIMTGDGADELFAGYDYMRKIKYLDSYIKRISRHMNFSSNKIGNSFKIKIIQPFLDKKFIDYALKIPIDFKIGEYRNKLFGKWILRKAFEGFLPSRILWQNKRPLEHGSGMTKLRRIIESSISNKEFNEKKMIYPIKFLNKEHLYYYEIYRKEIGTIPKPKFNEKSCPGCGTGLRKKAFHCSICGWVGDIK